MTNCKHCGVEIIHYQGTLWHEKGELLFPQYCKNFLYPFASYQKHEPEVEKNNLINPKLVLAQGACLILELSFVESVEISKEKLDMGHYTIIARFDHQQKYVRYVIVEDELAAGGDLPGVLVDEFRKAITVELQKKYYDRGNYEHER